MALQNLKRRAAPVFYPIEVPLRYKMENQKTGHGRSIELSSEIVRFECDETLSVGRGIELVLMWPAVLLDRTPLNLWIVGCITAVVSQRMEVAISRYEFRTRRVVESPREPRQSLVTVA